MMKRPNILLIMADQIRTKTLTGGGDGIETPNIDRIRDNSMFFPKAACTGPLCTPSRCSLATGKLPHNCGVLIHDANLPSDQRTYYQMLRDNGYRVAVTGKTDLHKMDKTLGTHEPLPIAYQLGFTDPRGETEGKMNSAWYGIREKDGGWNNAVPYLATGKQVEGEIFPLGPYQRYLMERDPQKVKQMAEEYWKRMTGQPLYLSAPTHLEDEEFIDNYVGRLACDYLENIDDETPWHLMVSFPGPHNPWDPPKSALEELEGKHYPETPEDNMEGKPGWVCKRAERQSRGLTPALLNETKRHYDAVVQVIDRQIGRILDVLERRGLADNTVVVFTADHGELMGEHNLFEKTAMYEGCLRIPMLIHLPGMTEATRSDALITLMDLAPTFLELSGTDYDRKRMDARSVMPLLRGEGEEFRTVQFSELEHTSMLYDGRYKLIMNLNDIDELYDLEEDPDELHNLAAEMPQIVQKLRRNAHRH